MKAGYIGVSTAEQNMGRQEILMREFGVEKVFIDKCSGKTANRPKLVEMMNFVRDGDTVVVSEIARFARSTKDLLNLIDQLTEKGVQFESQKEKTDTTTPAGKFMLTVFAVVSRLEREYILARQREGIEAKKARGEYKGRQPIAVDASQFEQEYCLWKSGRITAVDLNRTRFIAESGSMKSKRKRRLRQTHDAHNHTDRYRCSVRCAACNC